MPILQNEKTMNRYLEEDASNLIKIACIEASECTMFYLNSGEPFTIPPAEMYDDGSILEQIEVYDGMQWDYYESEVYRKLVRVEGNRRVAMVWNCLGLSRAPVEHFFSQIRLMYTLKDTIWEHLARSVILIPDTRGYRAFFDALFRVYAPRRPVSVYYVSFENGVKA